MKLIVILYVLIFHGCVSLERDIYFRRPDVKIPFWPVIGLPGSYFRSEPVIPVHDGSLVVHAYVLNKAAGSYLWGILVPVFPIFYAPTFHFHLDPKEKLKVSCTVELALNSQYLASEPCKGCYQLNKEGVKVEEQHYLKGYEKCASAQVTLEDNTVLIGQKVVDGKNSVFEFDYPASQLKSFTFEVTRLQLQNDIESKVSVKFPVIYEDYLRYYMYY